LCQIGVFSRPLVAAVAAVVVESNPRHRKVCFAEQRDDLVVVAHTGDSGQLPAHAAAARCGVPPADLRALNQRKSVVRRQWRRSTRWRASSALQLKFNGFVMECRDDVVHSFPQIVCCVVLDNRGASRVVEALLQRLCVCEPVCDATVDDSELVGPIVAVDMRCRRRRRRWWWRGRRRGWWWRRRWRRWR